MALCSLNWADIYRHYFSGRDEALWLLPQMEAAYDAADPFFCPQPSMPMAFLSKVQTVAPIAQVGRDRRRELRAQLGLKDSRPLVLLAPGGERFDPGFARWPKDTGVHWISSQVFQPLHSQVTPLAALKLDYHDIVASVDALVGKCGYGTVTECACVGTPLLYLPRPEWPEEKVLLAWLQQWGRCHPVSREDLSSGSLLPALLACQAQVLPALPRAGGELVVAEAILRALSEDRAIS